MNPSQYLPNRYAMNPYGQQFNPSQQQFQPYPGQIPSGQLMSFPPYGSSQGSPGMQMQQGQQLPPGAMWASGFPTGPIIEDLCAPNPMSMQGGSPPINSMPARMSMASMHPSSMPQVQDVFGLRQPAYGTYPQGISPHQAAQMQQAQRQQQRMMGPYPPTSGFGAQQQQLQLQQQQQQHHQQQQQQQVQRAVQQQQQQQQQHMDSSSLMPRSRIDVATGFPAAVSPNGLTQMSSPGGNPQAGLPMTPENGYSSFMSP
ncbi:hypothetical protein B0H63DRAFT_449867 [Podospora didyma]|uniref:Uncharacterized protein n=1 Tax=Podospora didyma TaxID=330526 RepID=A0AAE0TZY4_9PEZI|nr:hypothetical protein B0H63DRAFT_449867 [Podospora didyma]